MSVAYDIAANSKKGKAIKEGLNNYKEALFETLKCADSLKTEVGKLDDSALKSSEAVEKLFIENKKATKLFNSITNSFTLIEKITFDQKRRLEVKRSRINILNEPNTDERIKDFFGSNTPKASAWMLCGIEQELLELGIKVLSDIPSS